MPNRMHRTDLPMDGEPNPGLKPGLYLTLYHGRDAKDEDMTDWGFGGPVIGPLESCATTYAAHIRLFFTDPEDFARYFPGQCQISGYAHGPLMQLRPGHQDPRLVFTSGPVSTSGWLQLNDPAVRQALIDEGLVREFHMQTEGELSISDGLVEFDGQFYGDWSCHVVGNVLPTTAQIAAGLKGEPHG